MAENCIQFSPDQEPHIYHAVAQADYITILAITPSGKIPIVRQFRPAVEQYTWELPAGLLEPGEIPLETCRRKLKEETGLGVLSIKPLGSYFADTGRMENRQHAFVVEATEPDAAFIPEAGLKVDFVTLPELKTRIRAGEFHLQLHIGVVLLYDLKNTQQKDKLYPPQ
jgi:8-oxo-dGTP pyrophosphatase MutT (NUDIX family)